MSSHFDLLLTHSPNLNAYLRSLFAAYAFHGTRAERLGDGPDAVHLWQLARRELARASEVTEKINKRKERELQLMAKYRL